MKNSPFVFDCEGTPTLSSLEENLKIYELIYNNFKINGF